MNQPTNAIFNNGNQPVINNSVDSGNKMENKQEKLPVDMTTHNVEESPAFQVGTFTTQLPSKGLFNPNIPNGNITLKQITVAEERIIYSSTNKGMLENLVSACIIAPKFNVKELIMADFMYLLVMLRVNSYGEDYKVDYTCPFCSEIGSADINLKKLKCTTLDKGFQRPKLTLPMTKLEIELKLISIQEQEDMLENLKEFKKVNKNFDMKGEAYILGIASRIYSINGNKVVSTTEIEDVIRNLPGRDSAVLRNAIDKMDLGFDMTKLYNCGNCGKEFSLDVELSSEFFRPTYD